MGASDCRDGLDLHLGNHEHGRGLACTSPFTGRYSQRYGPLAEAAGTDLVCRAVKLGQASQLRTCDCYNVPSMQAVQVQAGLRTNVGLRPVPSFALSCLSGTFTARGFSSFVFASILSSQFWVFAI